MAKCERCGMPIDEYYTLQIYNGEPLKDGIAEEDCQLCLSCRIELDLWLNKLKKELGG